jgi:hypothetical protein
MTKSDLLKERDELAHQYANNPIGQSDFMSGFDACLKLMEETRVKPLREALENLECECRSHIAMLNKKGISVPISQVGKTCEALALVPEFEK